jgi:hypothetical protein
VVHVEDEDVEAARLGRQSPPCRPGVAKAPRRPRGRRPATSGPKVRR